MADQEVGRTRGRLSAAEPTPAKTACGRADDGRIGPLDRGLGRIHPDAGPGSIVRVRRRDLDHAAETKADPDARVVEAGAPGADRPPELRPHLRLAHAEGHSGHA